MTAIHIDITRPAQVRAAALSEAHQAVLAQMPEWSADSADPWVRAYRDGMWDGMMRAAMVVSALLATGGEP